MQKECNKFSEKFFFKPGVLLLALFLLGSCTLQPAPVNSLSASDGEIARDLAEIPQDPLYFALKDGPKAATAELLDGLRHEEVTARAIERFFSVWSQSRAGNKLEDALWGYYSMKPEKGFMENLRPYSLERWAALEKSSNPDGYPSRALKAITVDAVDLRLMPTYSPFFYNPARPGQGYPFDYYQNSTLPIGTPVFVSHVSADNAWALVESPSAGGWVDINKLAMVDEEFLVAWKSLPMGAILRENTPVVPLGAAERAAKVMTAKRAATKGTQAGSSTEALAGSELGNGLPTPPRFASIGTILPVEPYPAGFGKIPAGMVAVYYPVKGEDGFARMQKALLPEANVAAWPLPLTRAALAGMINQMMGQPYGWGGYLGNRDCSSTLRDVFLSFGVWLPRNSRAQAGVGEGIDLEALDPAEKEALVLREGVPFLSLVGLPGHIMLYLGEYQGRAVVFHNMWGLRTVQPGTTEHGRTIVGKAVITSLSPGVERKDSARPNSLLDTINKLSFPLRKAEPQATEE